MGEADQFIKRRFIEETAAATGSVAQFEVAAEIATPSLTPDGYLTLTGAWPAGVSVLAPWTLFIWRAVLDFKMEGDHVDQAALARVEHRRFAAWVQHLESEGAPQVTHPARVATVVVAAHLPDWLSEPDVCAPLRVEAVAPGCHVITPRDHPVVWVAANELPLHASLVPFLWARTGRPRIGFVRWLAETRSVASVVAVIKSHPMSGQITRQLVDTPAESEVMHQRGVEMATILLEGYPEVANQIRRDAENKGVEKTFELLFARRLGRSLTPVERATVDARVSALGAEHVGEVVLDLDRDGLERWLCAPAQE